MFSHRLDIIDSIVYRYKKIYKINKATEFGKCLFLVEFLLIAFNMREQLKYVEAKYCGNYTIIYWR